MLTCCLRRQTALRRLRQTSPRDERGAADRPVGGDVNRRKVAPQYNLCGACHRRARRGRHVGQYHKQPRRTQSTLWRRDLRSRVGHNGHVGVVKSRRVAGRIGRDLCTLRRMLKVVYHRSPDPARYDCCEQQPDRNVTESVHGDEREITTETRSQCPLFVSGSSSARNHTCTFAHPWVSFVHSHS